MITVIGLAALALLASAVTPTVVAKPARTILALYAATIPIGSGFRLPIPIPRPFDSLSSLLGALAIVSLAAHIILFRRGRVPSLPVGFWLAFLAWATITAFWAEDVGAAISTLIVAIPLVLLMLLVAALPSGSRDEMIMRMAVVIGGALVGAWALGLVLSGAALPQRTHGTERFGVVSNSETQHTNPNQVAASLLLPIALSIDLAITAPLRFRRSGLMQLLGLAGTFLPLSAIVLSGSRGGASAAMILLFVVLLYWRRRPQTRRLVHRFLVRVAAAGTAVGIALFFTVTLSPEGRMADVLKKGPVQRLVNDTTDPKGRDEIWTTGLAVCALHCATGVGLGNFPEAYAQLVPFSGNTDLIEQGAREAHNAYLAISVDAGMIGLTLLGVAIVMEWRALSSRNLAAYAPSLKAAMIGLLFANVFEHQVWFKYFWLLFTLIRLAEGAATENATALALVPTKTWFRAPRSRNVAG
jgi:O-Antigen ligase